MVVRRPRTTYCAGFYPRCHTRRQRCTRLYGHVCIQLRGFLFKVPPPRSRVLRAEEAQQLRDERAPLVAQRAVRHELVRGEERAEVRAARRRRRSRRGALGARPVPRVEDADLPNRSSIRILSAE